MPADLHPVQQKPSALTLQHAFIRCGLHRFVEPFSRFLTQLICRSAFSKWRSEHAINLGFDDFFTPGFAQDRRYQLYEYVLKTEGLDQEIDYLEFGVATGYSIRWWCEHNQNPRSRFVGFDTFTGLPERFEQFGKGEFSTQGKLPDIHDPRCRFEAGLFQQTLISFLKGFTFERRAVIHIDADLYSSTLYVLTTLAPFLNTGDIVLFDEFVTANHEFRAWMDFISAFGWHYEVIGAINNYTQLALKIEK